MMFLTAIGSAAFVFATFILFWWHANATLDVRVALAGVYLLIGTVATARVSVMLRLDRLTWRVP
jgi:hypothetical protein